MQNGFVVGRLHYSMIMTNKSRSLDKLDEDLLLDLNQVVHDNQLAHLPFARSGRAEAMLFDRYPELAERIERSKSAKIDAIVLSNKYADDDNTYTSFRAQSLEEIATSPLRQRNRRRVSKEAKSPALNPALKGKISVQDLMFEMSDGDDKDSIFETIKPPRWTENTEKSSGSQISSPNGRPWASVPKLRQFLPQSFDIPAEIPNSLSDLSPTLQTTRKSSQPWGTPPLPAAAKLDLRDIMAQDSSATSSNIGLGLSRGENERIARAARAKMSQKERKRLQQAQQLGIPIEKPQATPLVVSPWKTKALNPNNNPMVSTIVQPSPQPSPQSLQTINTPPLTMRQTVANKNTPTQKDKRTKSLDVPGSTSPSTARVVANERGMSVSTDPIPTPRSVRYIPLPQHDSSPSSQNLSIVEILSLQEAEKSLIRDATAKRSLQEIQQEQEFQAWWDQESRRTMEEEHAKQKAECAAKAATARGRGKGRGSIGGRGGKTAARGKKESNGDAARGKPSRNGDPGPITAGKAQNKTTWKEGGGGSERTARRDGGDRARGSSRGRTSRGGGGGTTRGGGVR